MSAELHLDDTEHKSPVLPRSPGECASAKMCVSLLRESAERARSPRMCMHALRVHTGQHTHNAYDYSIASSREPHLA